MATDTTVGYSLPVQFYDPKAGKSTNLQGAGLRIGKAGTEQLSPKVVAHNAGQTEITLRGRVQYTGLTEEMERYTSRRFDCPLGKPRSWIFRPP